MVEYKQSIGGVSQRLIGLWPTIGFYGPFKLIYFESFICKTDALRRENFYKSGQGKKLKSIILKYF